MTSRLIVNSIRHTGASADAITLDNSGNATFPANVTCSGTASGFGGGRKQDNLILNGAMTIAQRGTSSTTSGYNSVDRFQVNYASTDEAATQAQVDVASGTTPYTLGFRKALKITNGNQTGGAGTSDYIRTIYKIEAQDVANSGWNYTSASSYITLSFWVKASVAQTYYVALRSYDGTSKGYCFSMALSADTWTKVTHSIPGHADLSFDNNVDQGMYIQWFQFWGTNNTGTVTLNQWNNYSASTLTPDQTATWYTTNDATYELTGVQLEVGDSASDFQHRSFGDEYLKCCRYYQNSFDEGSVPGTSTDFNDCIIVTAWNDGNSPAPRFAVEMRAAPTMTIRARSSTTTGQVLNADVVRTASTPQISTKGPTYIGVSSGSANYFTAYTWEANAEL